MTKEQRVQQEAGSGEVVQELFQTAALILASQEEAVATFEQAVAGSDFDASTEPAEVYLQTRELLTRLAVERAVALDPSAFTPEALAPASDVCLDTDDWEATGLTAGQLSELVSGTGSTRLRVWLEHLRPASRVIFVLRAILGKDSPAVAETLQRASGGKLWTPAQVGQVFRGALCSLATSLVHAQAA